MRTNAIPYLPGPTEGPPVVAPGGPTAGLTLVELMIAVAIAAVLAVIATVGFTRYIRSGRIAEAHEMLAQIEARQETYFESVGYYCNASGPSRAYHPALGGAFAPKSWAPPATWDDLEVTVERGRTYFSYLVVAGTPTGFALSGDAATLGIPANGLPWYYVIARGDMDGKGSPYTELSLSSYRPDVRVSNEGR